MRNVRTCMSLLKPIPNKSRQSLLIQKVESVIIFLHTKKHYHSFRLSSLISEKQVEVSLCLTCSVRTSASEVYWCAWSLVDHGLHMKQVLSKLISVHYFKWRAICVTDCTQLCVLGVLGWKNTGYSREIRVLPCEMPSSACAWGCTSHFGFCSLIVMWWIIAVSRLICARFYCLIKSCSADVC